MVSWSIHIEALERGEKVRFRPHGNSMSGIIESGDLIEVSPVTEVEPKVGDAVLCRVKGNYHIHLLKAIGDRGYLIGNNHGHINGWTHSVWGVLTAVNPET